MTATAWIDETGRAITADSPWLGLKPFTEASQRFFFGRDGELRDMYLRVRDTPLTVLFGQSGLGKTSLLGAGLMPKLRVEGYAPVLLRLALEPIDPPLLDQIRTALATACASEVWPVERLLTHWGQAELWEILHRADLCPDDLADRLHKNPPVLILDQFEELFTLGREQRSKDELLAFGLALADLAENRLPEFLRERMRIHPELSDLIHFNPAPVPLVLTLREDYLSHLETWKVFFPSLMRNRMALHLLRGPQALEAVLRPARLDGRNLVDNEVAEEIVRRIAGAPAHTPMEEIEAVPPLLSLLCDELNRERGESPQISLQLVQERHANILQNFYERSFVDWPPTLRRLVEDRLVTVGGHRTSLAWEDAEAELSQAGVDNPQAALTSLVACRLLSIEERGRLQRLELTHDVLTPLVVASRDSRRQRERAEQAEAERLAAVKAMEKEQREKRRLRTWAIAASVSVFLALIAMGFAYWGMEKATASEKKAIMAQTRSMFLHASSLIKEDRAFEAVAGLSASLRLRPENPAVQDRLMSLISQKRYLVPIIYLLHEPSVTTAKFSPNGALILTISDNITTRVWDAHSGRLLTDTIKHEMPITHALFNYEGNQILTVSRDNAVRIWDAHSGQLITDQIRHEMPVTSATFSHDGFRILTVSQDNAVRIWNAHFGQLITDQIRHEMPITHALFSYDGNRILTISKDNAVRIWNALSGQLITDRIKHEKSVTTAEFSHDGIRILTASVDRTARIWDARTGQLLTNPIRHELAAVNSAVFSPDETRILTAFGDETARIWDASTGQPLTDPIKHPGILVSADFSPDGTRFLTQGLDKSARVWDTFTGQPLTDPMRLKDPITSAVFLSDSIRILTASGNKSAQVWQAHTNPPFTESIRHAGSVNSAVFSPDGSCILTASSDNTARVWDARTGQPLTNPIRHAGAVNLAVFNAEGTFILTASNNTAQIWDARTGQLLAKPLRHEDLINSAVFNSDGTRIVTASKDKTAIVWDTQTGTPLIDPIRHAKGVSTAVFSPDGTRILTADDTARIWDAHTGKLLIETISHASGIYTAVFNPDGTRILTGSFDNTARVWDARTGTPLTDPISHSGLKNSTSFSPDGSSIFTQCGDDTTAQILDSLTGKSLIEPIRLSGPLKSGIFSPNNTKLLLVSHKNFARIFDAHTGQPLTDSIRHPGGIKFAIFSPDGTSILTISYNNTGRVWNLGLGLPPIPGWFLQLAEAIAGRRINDGSIFIPVNDSISEIQAIRAQYVEPGNTQDPYVRWANWLFQANYGL